MLHTAYTNVHFRNNVRQFMQRINNTMRIKIFTKEDRLCRVYDNDIKTRENVQGKLGAPFSC